MQKSYWNFLLVGALWAMVAFFMATGDSLAPNLDFRIGEWLVLLSVGALVSMDVLIATEKPRKPAHIAVGVNLMVLGAFMFVYNITWQIWQTSKGLGIFPVSLYPFNLSLSAPLWYGVLILGMIFIASGTGLIISCGRAHTKR